MQACHDATIEALNGYIEELKTATTPISFTFLQFDHYHGCSIEKVHFEKPINDVPAAKSRPSKRYSKLL